LTPLRILSLSTLYPNPARPGLGQFVANSLQAAGRRDDVELTVVNPIGLPPWPLARHAEYAGLDRLPATAVEEGIEVHRPPYRLIPVIGRDSNPGRIVDAVLPLARKLHEARGFDLIDAQYFFPDGPAVAKIARDLGLPFSIKARGADIHMWAGRPSARRQILAAADEAAGLLAVSHALKRDMVALGMPEERIRVHYTGIDHARFAPLPRKQARALISAIPELGVWAEGTLLVCTGALIGRKGQRLAIEALARLKDVPLPVHRGAHLVLAGKGPDEADLRDLAARLGVADHVQFLGQVSHDLLPQLLSAADALVLPSASEGIANAWIEALACGTPVVIPDVGGAREIVTDCSAGRIVERDAAAIAAAIRELVSDPPDQQSVAANTARFSWEANVAELVDYWRNCSRPTASPQSTAESGVRYI
jgi:teichuronic acid biosynthesis glycosyltransferase TuaC